MRSITATEAKASLGDILSTLREKGPAYITNHNRPVAIIAAASGLSKGTEGPRLAELARAYADSRITWREIHDELGVAYEDLLNSLGQQGLKIPKVATKNREEQLKHFRSAIALARGNLERP